MRKLIVSNLISLDGHISGPNGDLTAMPFDASFSQRNVELLRDADTLLLGRRTYTAFAEYWPSVASDRKQPAVEREISRLNAKARKVVVSEILLRGMDPWIDSTEVVHPDGLAERVTALKAEPRQPGKKTKNIVTFGSGTLVKALLHLGLVDELILQIGANAVGPRGLPLFDGPIPGRLMLTDAYIPEDSQNVVLTYAIEPA
jgi:dihydrofolate reductase